MHSGEEESAGMTCLSSNTPEVVSGVCVFSGAMHREGSAKMSLIQMPGVMATVPLAVLLFSPRLSVKINRDAMVVSFGKGITFKVVLHQVWEKHHIHLHFLGFYIVDSDKMSTKSHGLLGMECSSFRLFRAEGKAMGKAILAITYPAYSTPLSGRG